MSSTERLRAMLDEHGIEWNASSHDSISGKTYVDIDGLAICYDERCGGGFDVSVERCVETPEQAVDWTIACIDMEGRTMHMTEGIVDGIVGTCTMTSGSDCTWICSVCGRATRGGYGDGTDGWPRYCSYCWRHVTAWTV